MAETTTSPLFRDSFKELEKVADKDRGRDLALMKLPDRALKVMIGVTVKSIVEHEEDGALDIACTLTVKLLEDKHGDLGFNINQEGDDVPRYRNRRYNQNGVIEGYTGNQELISCSTHVSAKVHCTSDVDYCPYIVSTYSLSIKLNSLDEHNERNKRKTIFVSRYLDDFIQFQACSVGKGVSKNDYVSVAGVSKAKKSATERGLPKVGETKYDGLWVDIDVENYETDELLFIFTTRRKQVSNLVGVVLPCIVVPMIFGELARQNALSADNLLTGVLTLVFAMPQNFGFGTAMWFSLSFILCLVAYIVNTSDFGIAIEGISGLAGLVLLVYMFWAQNREIAKQNHGGQSISHLVKDRSDEWKKLTLAEALCLV